MNAKLIYVKENTCVRPVYRVRSSGGTHRSVLRACGFKLANDGHDTRAIQHYLGHKNIQHTVRYTELAPDRFYGFWKD